MYRNSTFFSIFGGTTKIKAQKILYKIYCALEIA